MPGYSLTWTEPGRPPVVSVLDMWTIYASSGEYQVEASSLLMAAAEFQDRHPDDFVLAIVSNDMNPGRVINPEKL